MPALTTFTAAIAAEIVNARRIGSPFKESIAAAGVPNQTACDWLMRGRRWNAGDRSNIGDATYAAFAHDMDGARDVYLRGLRGYRAKGLTTDARLAHEVLKHEETKALRNEELKLLKQRVRVETNRADGTHIERHEVRALAALSEEELDERERAALDAVATIPALNS